jgi:hypothetical protein
MGSDSSGSHGLAQTQTTTQIFFVRCISVRGFPGGKNYVGKIR